MGCTQSAATDVKKAAAAPAAPADPPSDAPFSPLKKSNTATSRCNTDSCTLSPAFEDEHSSVYCGTSSDYIDISKELSRLIELHNSSEHIILDEEEATEPLDPVELTPEEEAIKKEHILEKLKKVNATRAVLVHDADMDTIEVHESVRAQLCEFFSK